MMSTIRHRPGAFKHINKKHKSGRHRSKGSISDAARGRVSVKIRSRSTQKDHNKVIRRQQASQLRILKRNQLLDSKRCIDGRVLPIFSTVISLDEDYVTSEFIGLLCSCDSGATCSSSNKGYINQIWCPRFKRHYQFVSPSLSRLNELLRLTIASDVVIFLWPLSGEISTEMRTILTMLVSQGLPTTMHFLPGLATLAKPKLKDNARSLVRKLMDKWSFGDFKLLNCDNDTDGLSALRMLSEMKKKHTILQKRHSYIICEEWEALDITESGQCTLKLTGYLRGAPLNVNRLIHIQGFGDYQLKELHIEEFPEQTKKTTAVSRHQILIPDSKLLMPLITENIPDPMNAEQTWPESYEFPKNTFETRKVKKKVPAGTSVYQAAWIVDEDDAEEDIAKENNEGSSESSLEEHEEEMDFEYENEDLSDEEFDKIQQFVATEDVESLDIDKSLVEKFRQERMDAQFPDEIDTPVDISARVRFQRYRGLKSFRTSPWDPAENLPISYSRIFKFADYKCSKKIALSSLYDENEFTASPGSYVSFFLKNVTLNVAKTFEDNRGMVIYSLLPHEQRMTVLNMVLKKYPGCVIPIANKQKLFFYVGYRRFEAQPIFSQHTNGDKFKMERFMPSTGAFVATVFAPIMFPPAPVLAFYEDPKGIHHLVASGTVLDVNPDRVILKRIVLSGHPFRIYRRHAVIRYMFFNRDDIEWFKPIELYTPHGRRGNILEPLGTHGYMKCVFDQQLNAMDSVMLNLYKRVYPKWTYNAAVAEKLYSKSSDGEEMDI